MAVRTLSERAIAELLPEPVVREVVELGAREPGVLRQPDDLLELRPRLEALGALADALRERLYGEDGLVRLSLRSVPAAYRRLAYAAIGAHIGEPVLRYGLLFEVTDRGGSHFDSAIPVSMTRAASGTHTDSSARNCLPGIVALLCETPSPEGGTSRIVDAVAACRALMLEHPEAHERLQGPFIRDIVTPGLGQGIDALRNNRFPVLRLQPEFEFRYMRYWIEKGQERAGRALDGSDLAALDALDATLERDEFATTFRLEAGEAMFLDNRRFAHGRDAYAQGDGPPRLLWRMWLDDKVQTAPLEP